MSTPISLLFICLAAAAHPLQDQARGGALIEALGDASPEVRACALEELRKILPEVEPLVRENLRNADSEVAARCGDLLAELDLKRRGRRIHLEAKIFHVDGRFKFVLVDLGRQEGLKPGCTFSIWRRRGVGRDEEVIPLAIAEFEKHIGAEQSCSKLRITKGDADELRDGDIAVATLTLPPSELRSIGK